MTILNQNLIKRTLNIKGNLVSLENPVVMGIINLTPDSFFKESRAQETKVILAQAEKMLNEGATFLDLGAFSTRPGAKEVSEEEERKRLIPSITAILTEFPEAHLSIDTFRSSIAREALSNGAALINDITAGSDPKMFEVIKESGAPYVMMHMRGAVTNMMDDVVYDDIMVEIGSYFKDKLYRLREMGVKDIIIDPGFGFSKTLDQNYEVLKNLAYFKALDAPILVGVSRKSMIYKLLETTPENALNATSALNFHALANGARILRVHDVKEAIETIKVYTKLAS